VQNLDTTIEVIDHDMIKSPKAFNFNSLDNHFSLSAFSPLRDAILLSKEILKSLRLFQKF